MARFSLQPDGSGLFGPLDNGYYVYSPPDVKGPDGKPVAGDQSQVKIVDKSGAPVPGFSNQDALAAANSDPTYGTHEPGTGNTNPLSGVPVLGPATDKFLKTGDYAPTDTTAQQIAAQRAAATADTFAQGLRSLQPGTAPQIGAATIDQTAANQTRDEQQGAVKSYQDVLSGAAPSVAALQLGKTLQTNILNQTGQAAAARGTNQALAQRTAAANIAQLNAGAGADAALLRANEQAAARTGLTSALSGIRTQDLGVAGDQATLNQDASSKNQASSVTTRAQDIDQQNKLAAQDLAAQAQSQSAQQQVFNDKNINKTNQQATDQSNKDDVSRALALSDRRAKTDVKPERTGFVAMLRSLSPASWEYKDPAAGPGKQFGVMAQDLEKTPVGKQLVVETAKGKAIDPAKSIGPILANLKLLADRLDAVEKKKR